MTGWILSFRYNILSVNVPSVFRGGCQGDVVFQAPPPPQKNLAMSANFSKISVFFAKFSRCKIPLTYSGLGHKPKV